MTEAARAPVLPAADLHGRIREAGFALLLTNHRPVSADELATLTGVSATTLNDPLGELAAAGWIDRDGDGRVTGSAGLSLTTGPHRLEIDGAAFRTWCAYDSIGIAAALAANAQIETECAVCGRTIRIRTHDGQPPADRPERLWLASGGSSLRGDFCDPTVLLCSPDHAAVWAERQQGRGRSVDLVEAATLGSEGWASCAATAATVRASVDEADRMSARPSTR
jgi:hypothetical protein